MTGWNESTWFAMCVGVALKSTVVLGAAWMAAFFLRGRPAAVRHLVWTAAAAAVLALPFLSISLPTLPVPISCALLPETPVGLKTTPPTAAERAASYTPRQSAAPAPSSSWRPDWRLSLMLLWAAGTL